MLKEERKLGCTVCTVQLHINLKRLFVVPLLNIENHDFSSKRCGWYSWCVWLWVLLPDVWADAGHEEAGYDHHEDKEDDDKPTRVLRRVRQVLASTYIFLDGICTERSSLWARRDFHLLPIALPCCYREHKWGQVPKTFPQCGLRGGRSHCNTV